MIQEIERRIPPEESSAPEGTWIQITFTLDPEHYRTLWQRAEAEHQTLPSLIRETVMDSLEGIKNVSRQKKVFAERNAGDRL